MTDLLSALAGEPFDPGAMSASGNWFECGCGTEWWISDAAANDTRLDEASLPCRLCEDTDLRRRLHDFTRGSDQ